MCLIQIKHAQIKFPLFSFWTVWRGRDILLLQMISTCHHVAQMNEGRGSAPYCELEISTSAVYSVCIQESKRDTSRYIYLYLFLTLLYRFKKRVLKLPPEENKTGRQGTSYRYTNACRILQRGFSWIVFYDLNFLCLELCRSVLVPRRTPSTEEDMNPATEQIPFLQTKKNMYEIISGQISRASIFECSRKFIAEED